MITDLIPWSLRGISPFLNSYGDAIFFKSVRNTPTIKINPNAATGIHSIVPHRNLYAYLIAIKSLLRYSNDFAVYVHDDGSLSDDDKILLKDHINGINILCRTQADDYFDKKMQDPFLSKVRTSYTSYLKLFDPTFRSTQKRIILLDSDTLFIKYPHHIIEWSKNGGAPWYHAAPLGNMKAVKKSANVKPKDPHIQTLIMEQLSNINTELDDHYSLEQGFCAGFIGYDVDAIGFPRLKRLLENLHKRFGDKIFKWGAEQTIHGLILCGDNAERLPMKDYFVYTQNNAPQADEATFIHFVGENRFFKLKYPRLASSIVNTLKKK